MSLVDQTTLRILLYEGTGSEPLPSETRFGMITTLLERGYSITRTGQGRVAPADRSALLVLGQFENARPPQAQDANGEVSIRFQDVTGLDTQQIAESVE